MSYASAPMPFIGTKEEYQKHMAKQEIMKRTANLVKILQWRYWLHTEIIVAWPSGWTPQDHLGNSAQSSDPNVWYREWLETHVGRQGWTWDWREKVGATMHSPGYEHLYNDQLIIKFRKPEHATMFALKFS